MSVSLRILSAGVLLVVLATALVACGSSSGAVASTALAKKAGASASPLPTSSPMKLPDNGPADAAYTAFNRAFLQVTGGKGYYRMSTAGGNVTFYKQVELIEMAEDAWQRSHDVRYQRLMLQLIGGLQRQSATLDAWLSHTNDDVLWAAIMLLRAYQITGDRSYVTRARQAFDAIYARAYSADMGGGLWGSARHVAKNTCVALPASVVASMLYQDLHQPSYRTKAVQLYAWVRKNLYDAQTGAVFDKLIPQPGVGVGIDRTTWTYNQGIFIGAADLLHRITGKQSYYQDAVRTLAFTRAHLTQNGILRSEVAPGSPLTVSSGGYKGVFVRWAAMFVKRYKVKGYGAWLSENAAEALKHANAAGLMDEDWAQQTGAGPLSAFSCSSAVVLLQWARPAAAGAGLP
jgi:predicted alpha-1,6-mannanase (GH76 family)